MTATKLNALANMMEDLTDNFQELSFDESYVDMQDEDGRLESVDVFGGKAMQDYPRLDFTAPTNNTQAVDRKKTDPSVKSEDVIGGIPIEEYSQSLRLVS